MPKRVIEGKGYKVGNEKGELTQPEYVELYLTKHYLIHVCYLNDDVLCILSFPVNKEWRKRLKDYCTEWNG